MINITEIVQSSGWKKFMAKLYGWGAAVVLLGALFKIQHWNGATYMLTAGMLTEVVIFFFSAFEPIHEEVDWTLVYPELAGISDEEDYVPVESPAGRDRRGGGGGFSKFDEMLENADIAPELFDKLGKGLKNLTKTTENLMSMADVAEVSNQYADNLQAASESINTMAESYGQSTDKLTESVQRLTDSYDESSHVISSAGKSLADNVTETADKMKDSYQTFEESIMGHVNTVSERNQSYTDKLESLNNNLSALNSAYELQLQNTNKYMKDAETLYEGLDSMMNNLKGSVEETQQYKEEMAKLSQNLASLNTVYGNMLSAMNVISNKG